MPDYSDLNITQANINTLYDDEALQTASTDKYLFFLKGLAHSTITNCGDEWRKLKLVQQDDIASVTSDPFNRPLRGKLVMFFENGNIYVWAHDDVIIDGFLLTFLKQPRVINYLTNTNRTLQFTVNAGNTNTSITLFDGAGAQTFPVVGIGLTSTQIAQAIETAINGSSLSFINVSRTNNVISIQTVTEASYAGLLNISVRDFGQTGDCELSDHTHREIVQMAVTIALENIEAQRVQSQEILNMRKIE